MLRGRSAIPISAVWAQALGYDLYISIDIGHIADVDVGGVADVNVAQGLNAVDRVHEIPYRIGDDRLFLRGFRIINIIS